jgi:hypothetical protein
MQAAVRALINQEGGFVLVRDGKVIASLALPIAGLMSDQSGEDVAKQLASGKVEVDVDGQKVSVGAEFFEAEKRLMLDGKAVDTVQIGNILALIEQ